ncbi:MAG: hypothetical protein U0166_02220 [Acidobacteriota bacterium]
MERDATRWTLYAARQAPPPSGPPPGPARRAVERTAPPEPAAAPSGAPANQFLDDARASLGIRAGFVDEVESVTASGTPPTVTLNFKEGGGLARQILGAADVMAILEGCARRHHGADARVVLGGNGQTKAASTPAGSSAATGAEVQDHPLVKKLLDVFQGNIAAVETLAKGAS